MILTWHPPAGDPIVFSRDATDYKLTKNYTGLSTIPVTHLTQTAPYQNGVTRIDSRLTSRSIGFEVMIMAPDLQTLQERVQALTLAFIPTGEGHLYYTNEAGVSYWIACMGDRTPTLSPTDRSRTYQRAYIDVIAFDPFWYSDTKFSAYLMAAGENFFPFQFPFSLGQNSDTKILNNAGDMPAPVSILISGECVNPSITNSTTGESIDITISMSAGDTFLVTTGFGDKKAVYTTSGGSVYNGFSYINPTSVLWNLAVGDNVVTLTDTSFGVSSFVLVDWRDRYIGV